MARADAAPAFHAAGLEDDGVLEDSGDAGGDDARGAAALTSVLIKRRTRRGTGTNGAADVIGYWDALRRGRPWPSPDDLDARHISVHWPGAVLMRVAGGAPVLVRRFGEAAAAAGPDLETAGDGIVAAMQIQWIQALAREVVRLACPLQDKTTFPAGILGPRETQCQAIGLPLSRDGDAVDHALCWIRPAP